MSAKQFRKLMCDVRKRVTHLAQHTGSVGFIVDLIYDEYPQARYSDLTEQMIERIARYAVGQQIKARQGANL